MPASPLKLFISCVSLLAGEMNDFNQVELTLRDILRAINPSREDWNVRFHIINEVRAVVGSVESLRGLLCSPLSCFILCSNCKVFLHLLLMYKENKERNPILELCICKEDGN